jgi:hypothetical protein
MQEQMHVMNARIFVSMTCDDPWCPQMMPEILEAIGKISRSEPRTTMGHLALELIIELLQMAIKSVDEAVASNAKLMGLE